MTRSAWLLLALVSCAGRCGAAKGDREAPRDDDDPIPLEPAEGRDAEALYPSRCLPPVVDNAQVQLVGNAVQGAAGVWVSAVTAQGLSVLIVPNGPRTDLRAQPGDAPAPAIAADGNGVIAAYFGAPGKNEQHVDVVRIGAPGAPAMPVTTFTRKSDESLAIDLVLLGAVPHVVWTEEGDLVVRSATSRVVLPAPAHAVLESPRLVEHGGHLAVFAIARNWESIDAAVHAGPQNTWEGAGEPRSTSWLVGYSLAPDPVAVPLTPVRGHIDAFDVAKPDGKPDEMTVFAHDAAQTDARGGGSLLRVRWTTGSDPMRTTLRAGDVGSGPIAVLPGAGILAYGNAAGDAVLVPLTPDLVDVAHASLEPSMNDARIIGSWPGRGILLAGAASLAWTPCKP